jgi:hypothetical protein
MADSRGTEAAEPAVISRRDAIVGALALAAGTLTVAKPDVAQAAWGDPLTVGNQFFADWAPTTIISTSDGTALGTRYNTSHIAYGDTRHYSFYGIAHSTAGAGGAALAARAEGAGQYGVLAEDHDPAGTALRAYSSRGTAIEAEGIVRFSRSGKATIPRKKSTVTVTMTLDTSISESAMILATLQGSGGSGVYLKYAKRVDATHFKVALNKKCSSAVTFAWMILG